LSKITPLNGRLNGPDLKSIGGPVRIQSFIDISFTKSRSTLLYQQLKPEIIS